MAVFLICVLQDSEPCVLDVMDRSCPVVIERVLPYLPQTEKVRFDIIDLRLDICFLCRILNYYLKSGNLQAFYCNFTLLISLKSEMISFA